MKSKIVIVLAVLLIGWLGYSSWNPKKRTAIEATNETEAERVESLQDAYVNNDSALAEDEKKKFHEISIKALHKMAKSIENVDIDLYYEVMSIDAILDSVEPRIGRKFSGRERRTMTKAIRKKTEVSLELRKEDAADFKHIKIVKIDKINDKQFIAYTNMWMHSISSYSRVRWWFIQLDDEQWRCYDYEDLDEGYRMTTLFSILLQGNKPPQWAPDFMRYFQASRDIQLENFATEYPKLKSLADRALKNKLPKELEIFLLLQRSNLSSGLANYEAALADIVAAEKLSAFLPRSAYTRGYIYQEQEKYSESNVELMKYAATFGLDSDVCMMMSDNYRLNDQEDLAKEFALKGINMNPLNTSCLRSYAVVTKKEDWQDLATRIDKVKEVAGCYEGMIEDAVAFENAEMLRWLIQQYQAKFPENKEQIKDFQTQAQNLDKLLLENEKEAAETDDQPENSEDNH